MRYRLAAACSALTLLCAGPAAAEDNGFVIADYSTATLIDKARAEAIWRAELPEARVAKVYPPRKWGFLSQVNGGIVNGICVVTARAVMLPRTSPTRRLVWEPAYSSTAFDARPSATAAQCTELAGEKLKEAIHSLVSNLVKN